MSDIGKTKEQLMNELVELRKQIAEAEHLNLILRAIRNVNQLITREKDRDRLLKGICDTLTGTRGCYNTWAVLLDETGKLITYDEAGFGKDFLPMIERLKLGELPGCGRQALDQSEVVVTKDPATTCTDCPLSSMYSGGGVLTVQLEHGGKVYGLLSASIPAAFVIDEETTLFKEVAQDIAFALHYMELEEDYKLAEKRMEHLNLVLRAIRNVNQLITRERERDRLLKGVCDTLIGTRGYHNSWAVLLDETGKLMTHNESGFGEDFLPMIERLKIGKLPSCGQKALEQSEVVVTKDPASTCTGCSLATKCTGQAALAVRLEHGGKVYGLLSASIPTTFVTDEETILFKEVAQDIAFALHYMELEKEHKQVAKELQKSEEKHRGIVTNVRLGIFRSTPEPAGRFWEVNPAMVEITGYNRKELLQMNVSDLYMHPEERELVLEEVASGKGKSTKEMYLRKKDGTEIMISYTKVAVKDDAGQILYFDGILEDITERKKAEQFIRTQAEVTKNMAEGAYIVGLHDVIILWANPKFEGMFGYEPGEMIGRHASIINAPTDLTPIERADEIMEVIRRTGEWHGEVNNIKKDRTPFWCYASVSTFNHPEYGEVLLAVHTDITERKMAEETLRESEEKHRELVEDLSEAIYRMSLPDGRYEYLSPVVKDVFGYSETDFIQNPLLIQKIMHPDFADYFKEKWADLIKGQVLPTYEYKIIDPQGNERWIIQSNKGIFDSKGNIIAIEGICGDITERKQAEEKLRESEEKYRNLISNLSNVVIMELDSEGKFTYVSPQVFDIFGYTPEESIGLAAFDFVHPDDIGICLEAMATRDEVVNLEYRSRHKDGHYVYVSTTGKRVPDGRGGVNIISATRDITERKQMEEERQKIEKLESIGTLAGGIAHDFNNILTGIMGNIGLARRYVEPKSEAEERLLEAEKASLRARDLTQQLLTFARGGAPIKQIASITELLEDSATFALRGSNVRCEFSLMDDLWSAEVDEGQVNQVITNLVINADEAMPEGGILNIGAKNRVVKTRTTLPLPEGNYVEITIEDHGVGISREHLSKIFDPYFTTKQKGSGLGLSTAYSIVKNHGGYITAKSKLGVGTTFHIYLPASEKPIPVEKEVVAETRIAGKGRVLVMDDEEVIRALLHYELTDIGYEVELTVDGAEAIEQYTKAKESGHPFDAVILDLTVTGGMGGKDVIRKLLEIDPNVKAIVSSGYSTDPIMSDFKEYGFSGVVAKPYKMEQLEKTLRSILKKR